MHGYEDNIYLRKRTSGHAIVAFCEEMSISWSINNFICCHSSPKYLKKTWINKLKQTPAKKRRPIFIETTYKLCIPIITASDRSEGKRNLKPYHH